MEPDVIEKLEAKRGNHETQNLMLHSYHNEDNSNLGFVHHLVSVDCSRLVLVVEAGVIDR